MNPIQSYKFAVELEGEFVGFNEVWTSPTDESMMWLKRKDFIQFPPHGFVSLRVFGSHHNMRLDGINSPKFITDLVYNGFNVTQVEEDGMKLWRWALHNVSFEAGFTYLKLNAADSTINVD